MNNLYKFGKNELAEKYEHFKLLHLGTNVP